MIMLIHSVRLIMNNRLANKIISVINQNRALGT